jgi:RNA polymerase sigma factor for flagellar operon FliA
LGGAMISIEMNTPTALSPGCRPAQLQTPERVGSLSPEDRQGLILENLSEVRYIARHLHSRLPAHVSIDDLIHAGVLGLIDAVEKFDTGKSVQFMSYARYRIRGAILDSLRGLDWGPRRLRRQARSIEQAQHDLLTKLGRLPLESEVAAYLGLPSSQLQRVLAELQSVRLESLEPQQDLASHERGKSPAVRSTRTGEDPFEVYVRMETSRLLTQAIDSLEEKERRALKLYYFEERTMKEVGKVLDTCESRVSQIISGALVDLRRHLQNRLNGKEQIASRA